MAKSAKDAAQHVQGAVQFLELGTRVSKIGRHWFQRLGTASS